jgi:hypothetical protein
LAELEALDRGAYLQFLGTLADPVPAFSEQTAAAGTGGSVRVGREDPQSPPKAAAKRGLDE